METSTQVDESSVLEGVVVGSGESSETLTPASSLVETDTASAIQPGTTTETIPPHYETSLTPEQQADAMHNALNFTPEGQHSHFSIVQWLKQVLGYLSR